MFHKPGRKKLWNKDEVPSLYLLHGAVPPPPPPTTSPFLSNLFPPSGVKNRQMSFD